MRIGIYTIALNEQQNLDGWLAATADADYRLIADTGSTDETVALAQRAGVHVERISVKPFRFDDAFSAALALMPDDLDVVMHCGLDVRPQEGWRAQLEQEWPGTEHAAWRARLDAGWSCDAEHLGWRRWLDAVWPHEPEYVLAQSWFESDGLRWRFGFAHSRHGFVWRFPLHELVFPDPRIKPTIVMSELTFKTSGSRQSGGDNRERNIAMLRAALVENPTDPRHLHYLGRELLYAGEYKEAVQLLERHATSSAFDEERSESWRYIGDCFIATTPIREVPLGPYRNAAETAPHRREGWVALADLCRKQDRWQECLDAAERALAIEDRGWYFAWPFAWGAAPYDLAALAAWFLGDVEKAREYGRRALEIDPTDERMINNLAHYTLGEPPVVAQSEMDLLALW